MKKYLSLVVSALIVFTSALSTFAASEPQVFIRGIRPLGMGGAFTAISDDQNAIFFNPAGITQRQSSLFTLFELPVNISEDVLNFYNFYNDNKDKLDHFDTLSNSDKVNLLNEINDKVTTYKPEFRTGFPNSSYISGPGSFSWGLGLFDQADFGFQFNRSLIVPSISLWGNVDGIVAAPIAHKFDSLPLNIPGSLSAGVTLKAIYRGQIAEYNKSVLEFEDFSPQIQTGKGFGLDVGTLYQPNQRWNVGIQVTDVGGTNISYDAVTADKAGQVDKPAYTNMIDPQWNVGTAYIPSKICYWPGKSIKTHDRLIFAADVRDILNSDTPLLDATIWKKLHLGAELRWGPLSLRGGYSSGYPTFGFGLRVPYLGARFDYAYWADELGLYAGQNPEWNHQITLAWSWGDQKGRAYGSDAANKEKQALAVKKPVNQEPVPAAIPPKTSATPPTSTTPGIPVNANESTTTKGVQPAAPAAVPASPVSPAQTPAAVKTPAAIPASPVVAPAQPAATSPVAKPAASAPAQKPASVTPGN